MVSKLPLYVIIKPRMPPPASPLSEYQRGPVSCYKSDIRMRSIADWSLTLTSDCEPLWQQLPLRWSSTTPYTIGPLGGDPLKITDDICLHRLRRDYLLFIACLRTHIKIIKRAKRQSTDNFCSFKRFHRHAKHTMFTRRALTAVSQAPPHGMAPSYNLVFFHHREKVAWCPADLGNPHDRRPSGR